MDLIRNYTDQIRLKNMELQICKDYSKKQKLQNDIKVLQYRKEIETIKKKISQLG